MSQDIVMLTKINMFATEIIKQLLYDKASFNEQDLKNAVENLTRSLIDLTSTRLENNYDIETTLQAALSKVKISYNSMVQNANDSFTIF